MQIGVFSTKLFSYHPGKSTFVAEASDLDQGNRLPLFMDQGYGVPGLKTQSHRTGDVVRWVVAKTNRDRDGDITHWELLPVAADVMRSPGVRLCTMTIFND